jgi:hypothetical protein
MESTQKFLNWHWELNVAANFFTIDAQDPQRMAALQGIPIFLVQQI